MYLLSITCFTTSETLKNVTGSKPFEVLTKSLGVVITCAICSKTVLKTLVGTLITIISEKLIAFLTSVVAFTVSGNLPTGNLFILV